MDELSIPKENAMARLLRLRETLRNNREQNSDATSNISEPIAAVNPLPIPISTDCSDGKGLPVEQCARVPIMPAGDASGAPFTEKYETPENGFREGAIVHEVLPGALKWTHGQEEAEAAELQNGGETVQPMPASDDEYGPTQSVEKVVVLSQGDSVPKAKAGQPSTELQGGTDRKEGPDSHPRNEGSAWPKETAQEPSSACTELENFDCQETGTSEVEEEVTHDGQMTCNLSDRSAIAPTPVSVSENVEVCGVSKESDSAEERDSTVVVQSLENMEVDPLVSDAPAKALSSSPIQGLVHEEALCPSSIKDKSREERDEDQSNSMLQTSSQSSPLAKDQAPCIEDVSAECTQLDIDEQETPRKPIRAPFCDPAVLDSIREGHEEKKVLATASATITEDSCISATPHVVVEDAPCVEELPCRIVLSDEHKCGDKCKNEACQCDFISDEINAVLHFIAGEVAVRYGESSALAQTAHDPAESEVVTTVLPSSDDGARTDTPIAKQEQRGGTASSRVKRGLQLRSLKDTWRSGSPRLAKRAASELEVVVGASSPTVRVCNEVMEVDSPARRLI